MHRWRSRVSWRSSSNRRSSGLWIFGWDRLPKRLHLATIWIAAIGTLLSAYFILAANAWMQNPVGYTFNAAAGRAELTDFIAVLTNPLAVITFLHTIVAAMLTAGAFVAAIALWRIARRPGSDDAAFRSAARIGASTVLVAGLLVFVTGDQQARVMTSVQPMKMAAAEALYETSQPASFSLFTIGTLDGSKELFSIRVPNVLSFLATGDFNGQVEGINDLQASYEQLYGPGDYRPIIPVTYWTFRLMIGAGALAALAAAWMLWLLRRGRTVRPNRWVVGVAAALPLLPLAANSIGWIFTELGRPAVDRVRADGHLGRRLAGDVEPGGRDHAGDLHPAVRRPGSRRGRAAAPADPCRSAARARSATAPAVTKPSARPRSRTEERRDGTHDDLVRLDRLPVGRLPRARGLRLRRRHPAAGHRPVASRERRALIATIGPVWDGNEVWVLVAGGATFAAFPEWYATLFSGFYLPLFLILVGLIIRGVAFEFRGKRADAAWRLRWDAAIFLGSLLPAILWGVAFANIVAGVPIDAKHEFTGDLFTLLNPYGLLGGLTTLGLFVTHGAVFLALKTTGELRARATPDRRHRRPRHGRRRGRLPGLDAAAARRHRLARPVGPRGGRARRRARRPTGSGARAGRSSARPRRSAWRWWRCSRPSSRT